VGGNIEVCDCCAIIDAQGFIFSRFRCGEFVETCKLPEYSEEKRSYIDAVCEHSFPDKIMYTKALSGVMRDLEARHLDTHLSGPKGCGKSVIVVSLFYILNIELCVFLNPWSFSNFNQVERLYGSRTAQEDELMYVQRLMKTRKYLLLDFGSQVDDYEGLKFLIRLWNPLAQNYAKVVALSSGYKLTYSNPDISKPLSFLYNKVLLREYRTLNKLTITGFTNEEADTFITNQTELDKVEVKKLGGTNPFLLTLACNCATLQIYADRVKEQIHYFFMHNLWIFQDDDSVSKYFANCNWEVGREYLFLVLQNMEFTLDQLKDFQQSWLHKSQLTIDVDEKRKRFNFPTVGNVLLPLIRAFCYKFVSIQKLAAKNRAVAAFACEELFITFLKKNLTLPVIVSSIHNFKCESLALSLTSCVPYEGTNFIKGIVYELYAFHPAIDFVGYLDANDSSHGFLVCLQLSLSRYAHHEKKLNHIIQHAPKKSHLSQGETTAQNLLTHYSLRATHLFGNEIPSVLFLYASPKENEALISDLIHEIKTKLSQYIPCFHFYVGVVEKSILQSIEQQWF